MRKVIIAGIVALGAMVASAAPSAAGGFTLSIGTGYHDAEVLPVGHYYGHRKHYYKQYCFIKKIRKYDYYGNLVVKRIRVCR
ncbi:hypothetical protein [Rhizobium sp. SG2393]|uniref:hypothetical protein n=1 Tax=Rhizobium sp. SG2393 TaxID=3276279 RepID=UPI003670EF26